MIYKLDDKPKVKIKFVYHGNSQFVDELHDEIIDDTHDWAAATITDTELALDCGQGIVMGSFFLDANNVTDEQLVAFKLKWGAEYYD